MSFNFRPNEPLPWQLEALVKLKATRSKIKLLQKIGGGGKTYCSYLYFTDIVCERDENQYTKKKVAVIGKPKEHDAWKVVFPEEVFNVTYISNGKFKQGKFFDENKFKRNEFDLVIFDEADAGLSSNSTNTFANTKEIIKYTKVLLLVSATLIEGDYVSSMPILQLCGEFLYNLQPLFKQTSMPIAKGGFTTKYSTGNEAQRKQYQKIANKYGYIQYEDVKIDKQKETKGIVKNMDGYPKEDIKRYKVDIVFKYDNKFMNLYKNIVKENFCIMRQWPLTEDDLSKRYHTVKRLSSGFYRFKDSEKEDYKYVIDNTKNEELLKLVRKLEKEPGKIMIFYESAIADYNMIKHLMNINKIKNVQFFDQDVPIHKDTKFLVGQFASMSRSIDMKDLRCVIFYSPTDSYKNFKQARFRVGRNYSYFKEVWEYYLIPQQTLHAKMYTNLLDEKNNSEKLVKLKNK